MFDLLILFAVSVAVSAVGWIYFIYFFSIGYGYGITALAVTILVMYKDVVSLPTLTLCLILIAFGIRLGTYLLVRERQAAAYRNILYQPSNKEKKPLGAVMAVWFVCALLYVLQVSPVAFRLMNTRAGDKVNDMWVWIGAAIALGGTLLETLSDVQKSAAKKKDSKKFVSTGLYSIVRCPNYLGELVIWAGVLISGFGANLGVVQWIIAILGYIGIVFVMFSGARRLEMRQNEVYGDDPEYKAYVKSTPILIPFVPIYSVVQHDWLKA